MNLEPGDFVPWNKGRRGDKAPGVAEANRKRVPTEAMKEHGTKLGHKNKGRKRPDVTERCKGVARPEVKRDKNGRFSSKD